MAANPAAFEQEYFDHRPTGSRAKALRARYWRRRLLPGGGLLLNLGSGLDTSAAASTPGVRVVSVDISPWALRRLGTGPRVCADACALPFRAAGFTAALAFDVLEHLHEPNRALLELHRVLGAGSSLVITVPNSDSASARLARRRPGRAVWIAHTDPTHVSLLRPDEWITEIRAAGFRVLCSGSDTPWAVPYWPTLTTFQVVLSRALTVMSALLAPIMPWTVGENLVIEVRSARSE